MHRCRAEEKRSRHVFARRSLHDAPCWRVLPNERRCCRESTPGHPIHVNLRCGKTRIGLRKPADSPPSPAQLHLVRHRYTRGMGSRIAGLLLLLVSFMTACAGCAQHGGKFVLLPGSAAGRVVANEGTWHPSPAVLAEAEAALRAIAKLKSGTSARAPEIDHPETFFRQYLPIVRNGRHFLYVNAFCLSTPPNEWRSRLFIVDDGGSCFWQALYDPASKQYSDLRVNGLG